MRISGSGKTGPASASASFAFGLNPVDLPKEAPARPSPSAPPKAEKARSADPHLGLRFWVDINKIEVAGFSECSGLTIETEVFEYAEGGLNTYTHKIPVRIKYGNITLKHGMDAGQELFDWYQEILSGKMTRRDISIIMYGSENTNPIRQWKLKNAFPVKWTGPDMKADTGSIAIETLELAHEGLIFDNSNAGRSGPKPSSGRPSWPY